MPTDPYGICGLINSLNIGDPALTYGIDLWSLGIDLLSPDKVTPRFRGPLHPGPGQVEDMEYNVPSEYMNVLNALAKNDPKASLGYDLDLTKNSIIFQLSV